MANTPEMIHARELAGDIIAMLSACRASQAGMDLRPKRVGPANPGKHVALLVVKLKPKRQTWTQRHGWLT